MTIRMIAALALLAAVDTQRIYGQDFAPIFNGRSLKGWTVEHTTVKLRDGVLQVGARNGWVRTERSFSDFVLKLEIRLTGEDATGGVLVRAWPTFDALSNPNNGYKVAIKASRPVDIATQPPGAETSSGPGPWRHVEIECVGRKLVVREDGAPVLASELENPQGHVALWASSGTVEFRAIAIKEYPDPSWEPQRGVVYRLEDGVVLPRLRQKVDPLYTAEALAARITGTIVMAAVVSPDGTVGEVVVLRSLDPKYGLDREAVAAAKQWRFVPGTRNGQPVAILVTIELSFALK